MSSSCTACAGRASLQKSGITTEPEASVYRALVLHDSTSSDAGLGRAASAARHRAFRRENEEAAAERTAIAQATAAADTSA